MTNSFLFFCLLKAIKNGDIPIEWAGSAFTVMLLKNIVLKVPQLIDNDILTFAKLVNSKLLKGGL